MDIGGQPVRNAETDSELVAGRALEDVAISNEAAEEEVVPRADEVVDGEGGPCGIVAHEKDDLRGRAILAFTCPHTEVIGIFELLSENVSA